MATTRAMKTAIALVLLAACDTVGGAGPPSDSGATADTEAEARVEDRADGVAPPEETDAGVAWVEAPIIAPELPRDAGIVPCAPVFVEADGVCRPTRSACEPGQLAIPSRGCVPLTAEVTNGPDEASDSLVIEVMNDEAVASGLGPSLADAVASAPDGATLRLGAGRFLAGMTISRALRIEGDGAAATVLHADPSAGRVLEIAAGSVEIVRVTVEGATNAMVVRSGGRLLLDTMQLGPATGGLIVEGKVEARDVLGVGIYGSSASVMEGASLRLERVTLSPPESITHLIEVHGTASTLEVRDSVLEARHGGSAVFDWDGADIQVVGSRITDVTGACASVALEHVLTVGVMGIRGSGHVTIRGSRIEGKLGGGPAFDLTDVELVGPAMDDAPNPAVISVRDLDAGLLRVAVRGGVGSGIYIEGIAVVLGTHVTISGIRSRDALAGAALRAFRGRAELVESVLDADGGVAVVVSSPLSGVVLDRVRLAGRPRAGALTNQFGLLASYGDQVTLRDVVVAAVRGVGVWALQTPLDVDGLWVDEVDSGTIVDLEQGPIDGVADGILLIGDRTEATLSNVHVRRAGRVSLLLSESRGVLTVGTFVDCQRGVYTTGSLDAWSFDAVSDACKEPFDGQIELRIPTRVRL